MRRPALALLLACLLLVAGASALDGYDYYQTIEYAGCDQATYQQDIVIHRSTGTAYNETPGGLETWHIYVGEHCQADYDDIRFTNSTGELAYYLWPDYTSSSARFAVRLEGADAAGELQVWYENPAASTTSDGDAVYPAFDHFDGSALDTTKWNRHASATVSVSNSRVSVTGNYAVAKGEFLGIGGKQTFDTSTHILEMGVVSVSTAYAHFGWADHYDSRVDYHNIHFRQAAAGARQITLKKNRVYSMINFQWPLYPDVYAIHRTGNTAEFYVGGTLVKTVTDSNKVPTASLTPVINNNGDFGPTVIDWVLVRAYSAAPPAATTFSGEMESDAPQPFPGLANIPRDLAGTGLYTDINGNNRLDYNDLTIFFQHLAWAKTAQPIACFDFNGNGWLDYNDVITLFSTIMEEHT